MHYTLPSTIFDPQMGGEKIMRAEQGRANVLLCYAMLCYAMLCYAMLCYAMLYYDIA